MTSESCLVILARKLCLKGYRGQIKREIDLCLNVVLIDICEIDNFN